MKRHFILMTALAAVAMLFAACSNLGAVVDEKTNNTTTEIRSGSDHALTISLTDASFDIARTVYPGDWTNGSKSDLASDLANKLVWVLTGFTVDDETKIEKSADSADFTNPDTPSNKYIVLDYEDLMNGTAQVNLKPLVWYFTLTAYGTLEESSGSVTYKDLETPLEPNEDGEIENTEVCLVGVMHADMTEGEQKVTFSMLPPVYVKDETGAYTMTTTAIGTAKYAIDFTPPDSFWYMSYAFYPEDTSVPDTPNYAAAANDAINTTSPASGYYYKKTAEDGTVTLVEATYTEGTPPTFADVTDGTAYSYDVSNVDGYSKTYKMYTATPDADGNTIYSDQIVHYLTAGKYWFRAEFYDTNNKRLLIHTEKFVIDGINISEDVVSLNQKTFSSAPQNITDLALQYTYNSVTFDEDPVSLYAAHHTREKSDGSDSAYPTTYVATLTWEDVADNEIGYQLWLRTKDGDTYTEEVFTPEDLAEDSTSEAKTVYKITSLDAGINTTKITLNTGVKYEIRLRAYNDRSVAQNATGTGDYGTVWGTYALSAKKAGYDYFVPYIPRTAEYDETDASSLAASDICFGLFTIDYNLNGGKIKQTSAKTSSKLHYTIPYIYKEAVNKLVDTSEFPYIDRTGYDFIGWNELYGNTGVTIDNKVSVTSGATTTWQTVTAGKAYYTRPSYSETSFDSDYVATIPDDATVSLDSIVKNDGEALTKSESVTYGSNKTATAAGSLATYTWTVTLNAASSDYAGHVVSEVEGKYIYSNLLQAGSDIPEECVNRELYASWETPLSMSITLPAYPSFKLTKIAAAGDPVEAAISADDAKNKLVLKASDKLSDLSFSIYYDDATGTATSVLTGDPVVSIDSTPTATVAASHIVVTDDTASDSKTRTIKQQDDSDAIDLATLVLPITVTAGDSGNTITLGTGGTFTWNYGGNTAGVYILKVTGTYTYGTSKTNSLAGLSDTVEGYIYVRLTN